MIDLAIEVADRLNCIKREGERCGEERRGSHPTWDQAVQRAVKAATVLCGVMPNGSAVPAGELQSGDGSA